MYLLQCRGEAAHCRSLALSSYQEFSQIQASSLTLLHRISYSTDFRPKATGSGTAKLQRNKSIYFFQPKPHVRALD